MFKKFIINRILNSFNNHKPGYGRFNCKTTKSFNLCCVNGLDNTFTFKIFINQFEEFNFKYIIDTNTLFVVGYNNVPIAICTQSLALETKLNYLYSNFYNIYDVIRKEFHIEFDSIFEKEKINIQNELERLTYIRSEFKFTYMEFKFSDELTKQDLQDILYVKDCLNNLLKKYKCYYTVSYYRENKRIMFNILMDTFLSTNVIYQNDRTSTINSRLENYINELN